MAWPPTAIWSVQCYDMHASCTTKVIHEDSRHPLPMTDLLITACLASPVITVVYKPQLMQYPSLKPSNLDLACIERKSKHPWTSGSPVLWAHLVAADANVYSIEM